MINLTVRYQVIFEITVKTAPLQMSEIKQAYCFHQNDLFLKAGAGILAEAWFSGMGACGYCVSSLT
jgi:hypothetical protein